MKNDRAIILFSLNMKGPIVKSKGPGPMHMDSTCYRWVHFSVKKKNDLFLNFKLELLELSFLTLIDFTQLLFDLENIIFQF